MSDNFLEYIFNEYQCNSDSDNQQRLKNQDKDFLFQKYIDGDFGDLYDSNFLDINSLNENELDKIDSVNINQVSENILDENYFKQHLPEACEENNNKFINDNNIDLNELVKNNNSIFDFDYSTKDKTPTPAQKIKNAQINIKQFQKIYRDYESVVESTFINAKRIKKDILTPQYKLKILKKIYNGDDKKLEIINNMEEKIKEFIRSKNTTTHKHLIDNLNKCRNYAYKFVFSKIIAEILSSKDSENLSLEKQIEKLGCFIYQATPDIAEKKVEIFKEGNEIIKNRFLEKGFTEEQYNSVVNDWSRENPIEINNTNLAIFYLTMMKIIKTNKDRKKSILDYEIKKQRFVEQLRSIHMNIDTNNEKITIYKFYIYKFIQILLIYKHKFGTSKTKLNTTYDMFLDKIKSHESISMVVTNIADKNISPDFLSYIKSRIDAIEDEQLLRDLYDISYIFIGSSGLMEI